ncbi:hypothetical protein HK104_001353 [Borealophlyctis nickersoniae]|nr:hypothetical protein HK104_001353 [Borealophlyctis nickersoniae]
MRYSGGTSPELRLTENETKLFDLLMAAVNYLQESNPKLSPVTLRVAGGWVRDKLLGLECEDIDIAIDTMKGEPFAQALKAYMLAHGMPMGTIATIQVNPEKSKHLETATAKVNGAAVDFVHLRTETYNKDSRNPTVDFGTPTEDALRRDCTINALFYNLNTRQVEDFTGKGLADLQNGVIRTPLEPVQTFIDDPLRVLRVIRFATRFGYDIDHAICATAQNEDIKSSFIQKITRERIGVEIDKMMKGKDPVRALELLRQFGFYEMVFVPPEGIVPGTTPIFASKCAEITERLLSSPIVSDVLPSYLVPVSADSRRLLFFAAGLAPFGSMTYREKLKVYPVSRYIATQSLKLSTAEGDTISSLLANEPTIMEMVNKMTETPEQVDRKALGLFVRQIGVKIGERWPLALLTTLTRDIAAAGFATVDGRIAIAYASSHHSPMKVSEPACASIVAKYERLVKAILDQNLQRAFEFKPLLDGKLICKILNMKAGPQIGKYLEAVMLWQLEHPNGTAAECESYVRQSFAAGKYSSLTGNESP